MIRPSRSRSATTLVNSSRGSAASTPAARAPERRQQRTSDERDEQASHARMIQPAENAEDAETRYNPRSEIAQGGHSMPALRRVLLPAAALVVIALAAFVETPLRGASEARLAR